MTRERLERAQLALYGAAIGAGLLVGSIWPGLADPAEVALWPVLAGLLYVTFCQIPLTRLSDAWRDRRFLAISLTGNFLLLPLLVLALLALVADDPALRLGLALVLLAPCTDWFISFAHLGGGDGARAIALTPMTLLLQFALLPVWLALILGGGVVQALEPGRLALAFLLFVLLPLAGAALTELWARRDRPGGTPNGRLGALPVPLLAAVVFLIATAQVERILAWPPALWTALAVCVLFLVGAVAIGLALARWARLPARLGRTLLFNLATRNSFVVLPFALALPAGWEIAALAIVLQSLVELAGMLVLLWAAPRLLPAR